MAKPKPEPVIRPDIGLSIFKYLFVPGILSFSLYPWFSSAAGQPGTMAMVLLLTMFFVWLAEQVYPQNPDWNASLLAHGGEGIKRLGRDFFYLFGITQVTSLLIGTAAPHLHLGFGGWELMLWPRSLPLTGRILLAFIIIEFFSYWYHRAAHRSRWLWQFHSTHHFVTELNGLKAVRTHPIDNLLFYVGRTIPLLLLGAGAEEVAAATYFGGILGIIAHANISVSDRWLGWFFNYPQTHAGHHSADYAESNSNYGCHTVFWDRVFRTLRQPETLPRVGVKKAGPRSLWQELAWPFYRNVN